MAHAAVSVPLTGGRRSGLGFQRLRDMRFAHKMAGLVAALLLLSAAVGALAISRLGGVADGTTQLASGTLGPMSELSDVRETAAMSQVQLGNAMIAGTDRQLSAALEAMHEEDDEAGSALTAYAAGVRSGHQRRLVAKATQAWQEFLAVRDRELVPIARSAGGDSATYFSVYEAKALPALETLDSALDGLAEAEVSSGKATEAAAGSTYRDARMSILGLLLVGLLVGAVVAWSVTRSVMRPLAAVGGVIGAVAAGDLTRRSDVDSADELGTMGTALNAALDSLRGTVATMAGSARTLSTSSEALSATSEQIAGSAQDASAQAGVVASAAEQVSGNVQTVAAGTEQMGASIREIAQSAADAARVAAKAVTVAASTTETVAKLGESSSEIGNVIRVITSIAEQTNLLALNATIEAARAGDAGRGFAVVAHEVKELAQETAKATEDISRLVEAIQADTAGAVSAIGEISEVIGRISDYQTTIAAAVEEQTATTNEMARNVAEAATGAGQIAENVVGVASAAEITTTGVGESQRAAADLARMSDELQDLVGRFQY